MNEYVKKYIEALKVSKSDEELSNIINKIYEDGSTEGKEANEPESPDDDCGECLCHFCRFGE